MVHTILSHLWNGDGIDKDYCTDEETEDNQFMKSTTLIMVLMRTFFIDNEQANPINTSMELTEPTQ